MEPVDRAASDADETPSTGFLPLSLAVALFITGLFVLGFIPGVGSCMGGGTVADSP